MNLAEFTFWLMGFESGFNSEVLAEKVRSHEALQLMSSAINFHDKHDEEWYEKEWKRYYQLASRYGSRPDTTPRERRSRKST